MTTSACRVCSHALFAAPLVRYDNMPGAAQFLPDAQSLATDRGVNLGVYQCSGCGIVQLDNDPVPYFREVIRAAGFSEEMRSFRLRQFGAIAARYSLYGKKAIEIGCGRGEYLSLLTEVGIDASGIEYGDGSVQHCQSLGLKVAKGYIDSAHAAIDGGPFSAFFVLSFLEHMPNPNAALTGIAHNLTDDAVGIVEVPNFDMILRNELFAEFIGDHLFYFARETLATTLRINGFDVIDCADVWHDYIISATVKKRSPTDLSHFQARQAGLKSAVHDYIAAFRRVAIWGAGHQALAVISLLDLVGKVQYVVDSAPFKQGKFTPASHLPIVGPEVLKSDPVEAIIVMAASYSDEVARILRAKFDPRLHVAILRDHGLEMA